MQINKADYQHFVKFLKLLERLEGCDGFTDAVIEWGISNTTFEQVFLNMFQVQSSPSMKEFGQIMMASQSGSNKDESNPQVENGFEGEIDFNEAILRTLEGDDIDDYEINSQLLLEMVNTNHDKLVEASMEPMTLAPSSSSDQHPQIQRQSDSNKTVPKTVSTLWNVITAIFAKNIHLQSHQRISTFSMISSTIALLVVITVVAKSLVLPIKFCPQGNTIADDDFSHRTCDETDTAYYLFHIDTDHPSLFKYDPHGENGYWGRSEYFGTTFEIYLAPRYHDYIVYAKGTWGDARLALPNNNFRGSAIWANHVNASLKEFSGKKNLFYPIDHVMNMTSTSYDGQTMHNVMYAHQQEIYDYIHNHDEYLDSGCLVAPESYRIKSNGQSTNVFAKFFADAIMECLDCTNENSKFHFNGTLWAASINEDRYLYEFINGPSTDSDDYYRVLPDNGNSRCPDLSAIMSTRYIETLHYLNYPYSASSITSDTVVAMQYINILTNSLMSPNGKEFYIQGGVSSYSKVIYKESLSLYGVFILTLLTSITMNSLLPSAVWRLSYE